MNLYYAALLVVVALFSTSNALPETEANQLSKVDTADPPKQFLRAVPNSVHDEERAASVLVEQFVQKLRTQAMRTKILAIADADEAIQLKQLQKWLNEGKKPSHVAKLLGESPITGKGRVFNFVRKYDSYYLTNAKFDANTFGIRFHTG